MFLARVMGERVQVYPLREDALEVVHRAQYTNAQRKRSPRYRPLEPRAWRFPLGASAIDRTPMEALRAAHALRRQWC